MNRCILGFRGVRAEDGNYWFGKGIIVEPNPGEPGGEVSDSREDSLKWDARCDPLRAE